MVVLCERGATTASAGFEPRRDDTAKRLVIAIDEVDRDLQPSGPGVLPTEHGNGTDHHEHLTPSVPRADCGPIPTYPHVPPGPPLLYGASRTVDPCDTDIPQRARIIQTSCSLAAPS